MLTDTTYDIYNLRRIRRALGYLGLGLPFILISLSFFSFAHTKIQPSISHYFHTNIRDIFSFVLFSVGFFFMKYKGYPNNSFFRNDTLLTNLAGIAAVGVAIFPTDFASGNALTGPSPSMFGVHTGLHYFFAVSLFLILALISINVFTLGKGGIRTKSAETYIYTLSGWSILACMVLAFWFDYKDLWTYSTLFFETIMLLLFSISWLVKGRALGKMGDSLYDK